MSLDSFVRLILEASVDASIIIMAVLAIQYAARNRLSPRVLYLFWFLVIARLSLPWMPESPASVFNLLPGSSSPNTLTIASEPGTALSEMPARTAEHNLSTVSAKPAKARPSAVAVTWATGASLFLVHVGWTSFRTARAFRKYPVIGCARANRILRECERSLGVKSAAALVGHDRPGGVVLFGSRRPRIAVPRTQLESLSDRELRHVFLHELAHWKRRDIPVAWIITFLQAVHWFNPLVWYAFYRMRLDREIACDALALTRMPEGEAAGYGRTLIKMVCRRPLAGGVSAAVGMAENTSQLERRINMISRHSTTSYRMSAFGVTLLAACAALFLTDARGQDEAPDPEFRFRIAVETYSTNWSRFEPGDGIHITEVRGTAPDFSVGERYRVKGTYKLDSRSEAMLHVYATNGRVESKQGPNVARGTGPFEREFTLLKEGMPHVNYYPAGGGEGFGGTYFRKKTDDRESGEPRGDLVIDNGGISIHKYPEEGLYYLVARVQNKGTAATRAFKILIHANNPETVLPAEYYVGAPLYPGETWRETSMPFKLGQGENSFTVRADIDDWIEEIDESNNSAILYPENL